MVVVRQANSGRCSSDVESIQRGDRRSTARTAGTDHRGNCVALTVRRKVHAAHPQSCRTRPGNVLSVGLGYGFSGKGAAKPNFRLLRVGFRPTHNYSARGFQQTTSDGRATDPRRPGRHPSPMVGNETERYAVVCSFARWNGPDASSGSCGSAEGMDRRGWVRPREANKGSVRFPEIPGLSGLFRGFPRDPTHVHQ